MIGEEISLYPNLFVETKHDLCYVLHACLLYYVDFRGFSIKTASNAHPKFFFCNFSEKTAKLMLKRETNPCW